MPRDESALRDMIAAAGLARAFVVGVALALAGCRGGPPPDAFTVEAAGARFDVAWDRSAHAADEPAMRAWITEAAEAVQAWYGEFPVTRVEIEVRAVEDEARELGLACGFSGPRLFIFVRKTAGRRALLDHPVLTHEMAHLAFDLRSEKTWMAEGQATYVEVVARPAWPQADPARTRATLVRGLRTGLPVAGDGGLDDAALFRSTRRLYEGGLLFWFVADVEIRRRTENRRGVRLDDAAPLTAIRRAIAG